MNYRKVGLFAAGTIVSLVTSFATDLASAKATLTSTNTVAASAQAPKTSFQASGFIQAPTRADIAYDTSRDTLYISGGDSVLRYDMGTQSFLSPIQLGGTTLGMDISPDGKTLAVANASRGATSNFIDLIDLSTGTSERVSFDLGFYEGGTFTVAYDAAGKLLISSEFEGSGWTPLRKYDPITGTTTILGSVRQNSMLSPSANRTVVAIAESNISNGPFGIYQSGDTNYASQYQTNWFNFEIAVSRDGSQIAVPTYGGTFITDANKVIPTIGTYAGESPIGAAYSPVANRLYLPFAQTNFVAEYDTTTGLELSRITTPGMFDWTGNHAFIEGRTKVAADGSYLFTTLDNGVYFYSLASEPVRDVPEPSSILGFLIAGGFGICFVRKPKAQAPAVASCKHESSF